MKLVPNQMFDPHDDASGQRDNVASVKKTSTANNQQIFQMQISKEALTNVARHAKASRVDVSIQKLPGSICMRIKDDGRSFDAERVLRTTGKGRLCLLGMMERLQIVGGSLDVESAPGQGTTILAHVPLGKVAGWRTAEAKS